MLKMPGESFKGPLPPLTQRQIALRDGLKRDVEWLAGQIGERNVQNYQRLVAAAAGIERSLTDAGYTVNRQSLSVGGRRCDNLEVEIAGVRRPSEIVVVGAHYDTVDGSPGANDNGSGVAAVLALARALHGRPLGRTLRLLAFVNEEAPHFYTAEMGSLAAGRKCRGHAQPGNDRLLLGRSQ
jgi:hypothetical protein